MTKSILKGIGGSMLALFIILSLAGDSGRKESMREGRLQSEEKHIDREGAISDHWDEIKEYFSTSETIEVFSYQAGNYYDLQADISDGEVEAIYFPNGGYLYFSADIDEDGQASDIDYLGRAWDFTVDMNSPAIDDAIADWAADYDYEFDY